MGFQGSEPPESPPIRVTKQLNKDQLSSGWFQQQAAMHKAQRDAKASEMRREEADKKEAELRDAREKAAAAEQRAAELKAAAKVAAMQAEFHKDGWFSPAKGSPSRSPGKP